MSGLKLLAVDEEDLKIISAHLQDFVVRLGDLAYLPRQHRFVGVLSRYCWEDCGEAGAGVRVQTGLHFDGVLQVRSLAIPQGNPDAAAVLLAIHFTPAEDGAGMIDLMFSGGGRIRLEVECIDAALRDLSSTAPRSRPPGA